jgi:hypothetical protein
VCTMLQPRSGIRFAKPLVSLTSIQGSEHTERDFGVFVARYEHVFVPSEGLTAGQNHGRLGTDFETACHDQPRGFLLPSPADFNSRLSRRRIFAPSGARFRHFLQMRTGGSR